MPGISGKTSSPHFSMPFFQGVTIRGWSKILLQTESIGSGGGFLVPTEYAARIHSVSLENEIVMPRCFVQPMRSDEIKLPGTSIGDHSGNLFGGFHCQLCCRKRNDHGAKPENPANDFERQEVNRPPAVFCGACSRCSGRWGPDREHLWQFSWYRDKAFLKGTGAGQPLGILNSPALIAVEPVSGQGATVVYENLTEMMGRMYAGSFVLRYGFATKLVFLRCFASAWMLEPRRAGSCS